MNRTKANREAFMTKHLPRRAVLAILVPVLLAVAVPARSDDYPNRPVHILVGFNPGSAADLAGRIIANGLGKIFGQQFIVENKAGAGSALAAEAAARAPKDGYTLLLGTSATVTNQAISANPSVDMIKDFAPIALVSEAPVILVVHPSTGVKSVQELIALAKAKQGTLLYASTGPGTAPHLAAELFDVRAGVKMVQVPYQGSPQAVTDLIAGRTSVMFSPASTVIPQVEAGKLVALASAAAKRPSIAPDLPTMAEAGMPDFETGIWFGLMAPAGTPRDIIDKLARAVPEAMNSSEAITAMRAQGFDSISGGPDAFARHLIAGTAKWNEAAKAAGLKK
jgi:tripartite-type tricarboxylate transporter receptor subunit TctC